MDPPTTVSGKASKTCRVSFDSGVGNNSPPESSFMTGIIPSSIDQCEDALEKGNIEKISSPNEISGRRLCIDQDDVNPSSSSSGSLTDEQANWDFENGYVVVGNERRRMSNAVNALDLEFFRKRKQSNSGDRTKRASTGGIGSLSTLTPRPSVGHLGYFAHPIMNMESGNSSAAVVPDGTPFDAYWPVTSTEQIMTKYTYKNQLAHGIQRMDHAFPYLNVPPSGSTRWRDSIIHGLDQLNSAVEDAWRKQSIGSDLAAGMADHLRSTANLDALCRLFVDDTFALRKESGKTIENYFSDRNRDYILQQPWFKVSEFLHVLLSEETKDGQVVDRERTRLATSLLESLIRHSADTCQRIVDAGGLDFLLRVCRREWEIGGNAKRSDTDWETLRDAASALCNLAVLGGRDVRKAMVERNVPSWMFVLLSHKDIRIRYYACLIVCVIASECECEQAVDHSQTLPLVNTFLQTFEPADVAPLDTKYRSGRSKTWLIAILPMIRSSRPEAQALACFQLAKEACLRRREDGNQDNLRIFDEIGALPILKEITSLPMNPMAANYAEQVLRVIGEVVPRKLTQSIPIWTVADVEFWVTQIGFGDYASQFAKYRVDGDLLLRTNERLLINEIGMNSEYERMRFMRELSSLKKSADYSCVDPTRLDMWMMGLDKDMSAYTYSMLLNGIDRRTLIHADDNILRNEGGITNTIHRMKVLNAIKEVKHVDELDIALLRKHVDIFICYRRSTGSQLASLLKVHLQLRGYKVFIDVDRLYAGQFDTSLLKNIRAAKHFLLVLTPFALDRCVDDHACKDWVHLEIRTALEFNRNIIPVQDKGFVWPELSSLPGDIRPIAFFNAVQWVHEYQEACIEKLDKFLKAEHESQDAVSSHVATTSGHDSVVTSPPATRKKSKHLLESGPLVMKQISEGGVSLQRPCLKRSATIAARMDSA